MNKPCEGTLYKVGSKYYCVGEKISKKVNGKTKKIGERRLLVKLAFKIMAMPFGSEILKFAVYNFFPLK